MKNKKYLAAGVVAIVVVAALAYFGFSASQGQGNFFLRGTDTTRINVSPTTMDRSQGLLPTRHASDGDESTRNPFGVCRDSEKITCSDGSQVCPGWPCPNINPDRVNRDIRNLNLQRTTTPNPIQRMQSIR